MPKLFASDRTFDVASYEGELGHLVIKTRQPSSAGYEATLLFADVRAVQVRSWFTGVEIELAEPGELVNPDVVTADLIETGINVYKLAGNGWSGVIVAGSLQFSETRLERDHARRFEAKRYTLAGGTANGAPTEMIG